MENKEQVIDCKADFKFSDDRMIHKSLLDKWNIPYNEKDLEGGVWLRQEKKLK